MIALRLAYGTGLTTLRPGAGSRCLRATLYVYLACAAVPVRAHPSAQPPTIARIAADARSEVAAALYAASATQSAALRAADAKLRALRTEIERLREERQQTATALAEAQEQYVTALAARDRTYAEEIRVFRNAVQDIAATPEGVAALSRFNAGDVSALTILDKLRAGRDAARRRGDDIESAAEGRRIAMLALD